MGESDPGPRSLIVTDTTGLLLAAGTGRLKEMRKKFEEIERRQLGKEGLEDAVRKVAAIEQALGYADLAQFTASPPPHA